MKLYLLASIFLVFVFSSTKLNAQQVFWVETFGTGCNTGTLANNETTSNGTWTVTNTGINGADANVWYISAEENAEGVGSCGANCGSNPTLHIGTGDTDLGATYLKGDGDTDVATDIRAESPTIDCTGKCDVELSFEYLENGDGALDNHILWYFDGSSWAILEDTPKTPTGCAPQGEWTLYTVDLPASADNNPDVQIGFQWVNNNDELGSDPSVAIYNIRLTSNDTEAPTITCVNEYNVYLNQSNCQASIPEMDTATTITVSDNCTSTSDLMISQDIASGTTISGHLSQQDVIVEVEDLSGNTNTCVITVIALDTIIPSLACPSNKTQNTQPGSCDTLILDYTDQILWDDNCTSSAADMTFTQSINPGELIEGGINTITITATDEAGNSNSCNFQLEVVDIEDPSITCPDNQEQFVNSACNISLNDYTNDAIVTDNCSSSTNISITQSPLPGTTISGAGNIQIVTLIAEDEAGNTSSCEFEVAIFDTIAPIPSCPANDTVGVNNECEYQLTDITGNVGASDNCTSFDDLVITQNIPAGTILSVGSYSIEINVEDEAGNIGTCFFNLEVMDLESPVIVECAPDISISANEDCEGVLGDYTELVNATDNCEDVNDLIVTQNPAVGTVITTTTIVELTVSDLAGNTTSCSFEVAVIDDEDPDIICPSEFTVSVDSNCDFDAPDLSEEISGSDNCSLFSDMFISQDPAPFTTLNGSTQIEVFLEDESGNIASCFVSVVPEDTVPPTIDCPTNQLVNIGTSCEYEMTDFTGMATVSDNCPNVSVAQSPAEGTLVGTGTTIVTLTATDGSGNEASCTFELFVEEDVAPEITCPDPISSCDPIVNYSSPVGSDNCESFLISQIDETGYTSGDEFPIGITSQTYEIVDSSGNSSNCTFEIEIYESPSAANIITNDLSLCDTLSVFLEAEAPDTGTGTWSVEEGSGTLNNEMANNTGANNLSIGTNVFVWEVETPLCGSNSDTVTITVYEIPVAASNSDTVLSCNDLPLNISGNTPNIGTGLWYGTNPNITFSNENSPNTFASNFDSGWNDLIWQISNGSCPITRDTLRVYFHAKPIIANNDTTICIAANEIALDAGEQAPDVSSGWYFIEGGGDFENQSATQAYVFNLVADNNRIVYASVHPNCGTKSDTVSIFVDLCGSYDPVIPTVITPNNDGKNDLLVIENLHILYPESHVVIVNRWGNVVFESEGYEEPWNGTKFNTGEELPLGTYFYRINLNNGSGHELKGPISIIR